MTLGSVVLASCSGRVLLLGATARSPVAGAAALHLQGHAVMFLPGLPLFLAHSRYIAKHSC